MQVFVRLLPAQKRRFTTTNTTKKSKRCNVLFLCTGNPCRSVLAASFTFNHLAPAGWRAMSAGSHPASCTSSSTGVVGAGRHFNRRLFQQIVGNLSLCSAFTHVVTVCSNAAGETCPLAPLGNVMRTHWALTIRLMRRRSENMRLCHCLPDISCARIEAFFWRCR
ncbi:hypothetical protein KCP71_16730 [Salmonella enterica subsp. enterica]|nr:hypothetical protein KCP71_16730 [Salmonella enterica subsp. enterica]